MDDPFFAVEIDQKTVEIDLHNNYTITGALEQLEKELFLVFNNGAKNCRVVHGIGAGKLALAVHDTLTHHPLVRQWKESERGGSCLVIFSL